jgi:hypothetical protein
MTKIYKEYLKEKGLMDCAADVPLLFIDARFEGIETIIVDRNDFYNIVKYFTANYKVNIDFNWKRIWGINVFIRT